MHVIYFGDSVATVAHVCSWYCYKSVVAMLVLKLVYQAMAL